MTDCPHCRRFRERAEELEEELRQLRAGRAAVDDRLPVRLLRLTVAEEDLLRILVGNYSMSKDAYSDERDHDWGGQGANLLHVHICKLRQKLKPFGITVDTLWGRGYAMTEAMKDKLRQLAADQRQAA